MGEQARVSEGGGKKRSMRKGGGEGSGVGGDAGSECDRDRAVS